MRRLTAGLITALATTFAVPALAHPHVWVTVKSQIVYADDGKVSGVRHAWTFDEAYSAFATQGLDTNGDGKFSADELAELAKTNVESLSEFDYFTVLKANGVRKDMSSPVDYSLAMDGGSLTLSFTLPLKEASIANRSLGLEVYDPTFFVSFAMAEGDAALQLAGNAPKGCAINVSRPKNEQIAQQKTLSESFFESLGPDATFGLQFANKVLVACP